MSVISIRPATEKLQNLGPVRSPDRMPHLTMPDTSGQKALARAWGDLGRGIGRIGEVGLRLAIDARKEDEDRRLAAAGAEYQRRLQEGFLEGDDPLMARQGDALEGDGLKQTQADTEQLFKRSFDESCAQYGIDGRLKERFALHCAPVALSWNGRMDGHVMAERKKNGIAAADKLVERDEQDWAGDKYNAALTQKIIDDYDHKLKVRGMTEDVRAAEVRKYALGLAVDVGRSSFDGIDSEGAFDEKIRLVKEDPDGLFNDNDELRERLGKNALPEKTVELLVDDLKQRKAKFVLEQTRAVNAEVDVLVAEGDLGKMDKGVDDLKARCESLPEDSKVRAATLEAAAKLDKYADGLCQYQLMNDLANGVKLTDDDGKAIFAEGTRQARLFPKVKAAFDEQMRKEFNKGFRAAHDQNLLVADAAMMQYAATGNPQGFYGFLTDAVVNRKITTGDFTRLRDKFNNGWMKGFSAMPGQQSKQSAMAQDMLDAIKTKLGVDLSTAIKTNDFGDPAIKNGALDWNDEAELPDASVRRQYKPFDRPQGIFRLFKSDTPTRKETIEGQQLRAALDEAMKLWNSDGMQIEIDPVTGERLPDGKTHTVNAVADFNALLDRLVDERNILSAADTLKQQAVYAENVRGNAMAAEIRRAEKRTNSKPVTDGQVEKKDDKGE